MYTVDWEAPWMQTLSDVQGAGGKACRVREADREGEGCQILRVKGGVSFSPQKLSFCVVVCSL